MMRALVLLGFLFLLQPNLAFSPMTSLARADETAISVTVAGQTRSFTRSELLARPDLTSIAVAHDIAYRAPMTYRAVPVAALFAGMVPPADGVIEAVTHDGFIAQLPTDLVLNTDAGKAVAWLAIEPADQPWPPIPQKTESAGPFYIVWTGAAVGTIRSEQWPYQVAKLISRPSPAARWPAIAVDPALPPADPARAGQALFIVQCLPCHKMNGGGASDVGPDLNRPQNPTAYFSPQGLHDVIRNPKTVRAWPAMTMPAFPSDNLSDREIGLIVAYLKHMAGRKPQ